MPLLRAPAKPGQRRRAESEQHGRPIERANQIDLETLQEVQKALRQQRASHVELLQQLRGGGRRHAKFRRGLKSTRPGIVRSALSLFNPVKWVKYGPAHPLGVLGNILDRAVYSKIDGAKLLKAAPSTSLGKKGVLTSPVAEIRRAVRLNNLRKKAGRKLKGAFLRWDRATKNAFAELRANPTPEQLQKYQGAIGAANSQLAAAQLEAQRAFNKALQERTGTKGKYPMPLRRL